MLTINRIKCCLLAYDQKSMWNVFVQNKKTFFAMFRLIRAFLLRHIHIRAQLRNHFSNENRMLQLCKIINQMERKSRAVGIELFIFSGNLEPHRLALIRAISEIKTGETPKTPAGAQKSSLNRISGFRAMILKKFAKAPPSNIMQMHVRIGTTVFGEKWNQEVSIFIVINGKLSAKSFKVDTWIRNEKSIRRSWILE